MPWHVLYISPQFIRGRDEGELSDTHAHSAVLGAAYSKRSSRF